MCCGIMVIIESVGILNRANTLRKGMNLITLYFQL